MARFLGTSSPKTMVTPVDSTKATTSDTLVAAMPDTPTDSRGPSMRSAMAGSARKPISRLVSVMPSWAADSCVDSVRSASRSPRARRSPASAARSTDARSTVTNANSAATKVPHAATSSSASVINNTSIIDGFPRRAERGRARVYRWARRSSRTSGLIDVHSRARPWQPPAGVRSAGGAPPDSHPIDHQQQQRPRDGDQPRADIEEVVELADVQRACDQATNEGADDPDHHRHEDAAGIVAGQDRLGDRSGEQAQNDPTDDAHTTAPVRGSPSNRLCCSRASRTRFAAGGTSPRRQAAPRRTVNSRARPTASLRLPGGRHPTSWPTRRLTRRRHSPSPYVAGANGTFSH